MEKFKQEIKELDHNSLTELQDTVETACRAVEFRDPISFAILTEVRITIDMEFDRRRIESTLSNLSLASLFMMKILLKN